MTTHPDYYNTSVSTHADDEDNEYKRYRKIRTAKYVLSSFLALTGFFILGTQLYPLGHSYIKGKLMEAKQEGLKDPSPETELNPENSDLPYYDPGMSYFQNLVQHISTSQVAGATSFPTNNQESAQAVVDESYSNEMKISMPSIGIENVPITPNVDSIDENVYNQSLKKGLAHFKGTPLPGDGGNSFIYGHSAIDSFFSSHTEYAETILTKLENIEISDTIVIEKDGKKLEYTVQKKKITEPEDFEVLSGILNKETITLMTCWPLGVGSKRLIVIGELISG
ncbi:MAG: sortase [Patescibacteria group bacterium]|nr:sortase [Patescibacteria group bacterium]